MLSKEHPEAGGLFDGDCCRHRVPDDGRALRPTPDRRV